MYLFAQVWLMFIVSNLAFIGLMTFVAIKMPQKNRTVYRHQAVYQQFEYVLANIFGQGSFVSYATRTCVKMAIAAWLLAMLVIINAYCGVKTSMMAVPHYDPIFNSLEQVVETNGRVRITTETAAVITNQFLVTYLELHLRKKKKKKE